MINRLAIIGLGSIGKRHIRLISEIRPEIEIILVRSGIGGSCQEEDIATKVVYSINDAINEGIQAAVVSSPATLHLEQSLELVKNGIHVLVEKPLSHNAHRIDEFLKAVNDNGVKVMVGYVLRYDNGAIKFKEWLSQKCTGRIMHARIECGSYLPEWREGQDYRKTVSGSAELGGGILLELSHELDYLYWFFGSPIDVQAHTRNSGILDINVEDQADLILTSYENYPITVQLDFNRRYAKRICNVLTTDGELTWNAIKKEVTWKKFDNEQLVYGYDNDRDYIYRQQIKSFLSCIEEDMSPVVSSSDGAKVMKLIDAIRCSANSGSRLEL